MGPICNSWCPIAERTDWSHLRDRRLAVGGPTWKRGGNDRLQPGEKRESAEPPNPHDLSDSAARRNPLKPFGHTCHAGGRGFQSRRSNPLNTTFPAVLSWHPRKNGANAPSVELRRGGRHRARRVRRSGGAARVWRRDLPLLARRRIHELPHRRRRGARPGELAERTTNAWPTSKRNTTQTTSSTSIRTSNRSVTPMPGSAVAQASPAPPRGTVRRRSPMHRLR